MQENVLRIVAGTQKIQFLFAHSSTVLKLLGNENFFYFNVLENSNMVGKKNSNVVENFNLVSFHPTYLEVP